MTAARSCWLVLGLLLAQSAPVGIASETRRLSLYHTHTKESLEVTYHAGGAYVPAALDELEQFLADFRNGERHPIDPQLFDILHELMQNTGSKGTFEIISCYRSPETNEMLRRNGRGVASKSLHMEGKAIDVRLTDVDTATLRDAALALGKGGVGYYASSDFVHVDTGRVRRW